MREIKFRAWDSHEKHMYTVTELSFMKYDSKPIQNGCEGFWGDNHRKKFALDELNIMQYTGLKDKNGKEIYEGDIVKTKWQEKAEMVWVEHEAAFCLKTIDDVVKDGYMYGFKDTEMEVIGNIYENPELLQ